ncbi:MAG: tripartite tricarboxylate transporter TctB family protein [Acidiferrobacterales bacterium]|nr:tripartite tricarboxylate transporter TctB family protein [Acidiferrobacterales bacterium]
MANAQAAERSRWTYLLEAGGWLLFILLAFIYTFQFDGPLPVYDWGPAHWPRVILLCMLAASLRLLYRDWRQSSLSLQSTTQTAGDDDFARLETSVKIRMVLVFAVPVLYTFLMHKMGFLLVTPFFLFGYMWLMGVRRLRTLIILTTCIYSALVLVFVKLIFTYLPPGAGVFNTLNGKFLGILM